VAGFVVGADWSVYRRFDKDYGWWDPVKDWRLRVATRFLAAAQAWSPVITAAVEAVKSAPGES
jgi:purine-cytosine permease-like protein